MPICDPKCQHGECRAPNFCACEIGWEGTHCDTCVPLPGCDHGTCENALECNCEDGWDGAYCDIRKQLNAIGYLFLGYTKKHFFIQLNARIVNMDVAWPPMNVFAMMVGVAKIVLAAQPYPDVKTENVELIPTLANVKTSGQDIFVTNLFASKFTPLNNLPSIQSKQIFFSSPVCVNGKCMEKNGTHFCRCNLGWQKEACDACVPYWDCPYKGEGACEKSNECRCPNDTSDPDGLCESFFTPAN